MHVHLGCGRVYLRDWKNVDLHESGSVLTSDCSRELVEQWATTEDAYYAKAHASQDELGAGVMPSHSGTVCDLYGSWDFVPVDDGSVDELLSRQVFEHLSHREARAGIMEARRILKMGGILRIDVPDVEESLLFYADAEHKRRSLPDDAPESEHQKACNDSHFFLRHLLGSRKNDGAYHYIGWTRLKLRSFVEWYGFEFIEEEPNIHYYPAFCLKFRKMPDPPNDRERILPWNAAWEYAGDPRGTPISVPDQWQCVEIGPGKNPWPRANFYIDIDGENLKDLPEGKTLKCDVHKLPDDMTGRFAFAFVSHCMEHLDDPVRAAAEIQRVAPNGVIVCPSPLKEGLWAGVDSPNHKFLVLPPGKSGAMRFIRFTPAWRDAITNGDWNSAMHQILRYTNKRFGAEGDIMRKAWRSMESAYDTIHRYQEGDPLKVEVYE